MSFDSLRRLVIPCFATALVGACQPPAETVASSVQLQVLETPSAAGSLGPHLAAGADGTLVLSWIEPVTTGHALRWAVLGEHGWSTPRTAATGANWFVNWADVPSVAPLSPELWAAHWLVRQPAGGYAYDVLVALSTDRGASWSEPVHPHDDGTVSEHGFVTLFPRGAGAGLVWLDGRHTTDAASPGAHAHGMSLRAATVTPDLRIVDGAEIDSLTCDCCRTGVALVPGGAVAVYRDRSPQEIRDIVAARLTAEGWQPPATVAADGWLMDGCPVNGPAIAADGERLAVTWFTAADDAPRVRLAGSTDAGATWSAAVDIATQRPAGHADVALLPDGRAAVSWVCEQPSGPGVCLRTVAAGGGLGPVLLASGDARLPALGVPQLARSDDRLVLAWTEESGDTTRVASAWLALDSLP